MISYSPDSYKSPTSIYAHEKQEESIQLYDRIPKTSTVTNTVITTKDTIIPPVTTDYYKTDGFTLLVGKKSLKT